MSLKSIVKTSVFISLTILSLISNSFAITIEEFQPIYSDRFSRESPCIMRTDKTGATVHGAATSTGSLGNIKTISITPSSGNTSEILTSSCVGNFQHAANSGSRGITQIVWDGDALPGVTSLTKLSNNGVNLLEDGSNAFTTEIYLDLLDPFPVTIRIYDANDASMNTWSEVTKIIHNTDANGRTYRKLNTISATEIYPATKVEFPFAEFNKTAPSGKKVDLTRIGAISITFDGSSKYAFDLMISAIRTNGSCTHIPVNGKILDQCGVCNGPGPSKDRNSDGAIDARDCRDCAGNFLGDAIDQGCGCNQAPPSGCDNQCGSTKSLDLCGVCGGTGPAADISNDGIIDVKDCTDCNGKLGGSSKDLGCGCDQPAPSGCDNSCGSTLALDVCGVCAGKGAIANQKDLLLAIDSNTNQLGKSVNSLAAKLRKISKNKSDQAYSNKIRSEVTTLVNQSWATTWAFPIEYNSCSSGVSTTCIKASTIENKSQLNNRITGIYQLGKETYKRITKASSKKDKTKYKKQLTQITKLYNKLLKETNLLPNEINSGCI